MGSCLFKYKYPEKNEYELLQHDHIQQDLKKDITNYKNTIRELNKYKGILAMDIARIKSKNDSLILKNNKNQTDTQNLIILNNDLTKQNQQMQNSLEKVQEKNKQLMHMYNEENQRVAAIFDQYESQIKKMRNTKINTNG